MKKPPNFRVFVSETCRTCIHKSRIMRCKEHDMHWIYFNSTCDDWEESEWSKKDRKSREV